MKDHYRPLPQPKHDPGKHATPWHRAVAAAGTILRAEVGSGVHGTSVSGYDDRDEMGVCIEPADAVIGFKKFEQYEWHTAWERPGGRANRSGHGDLDITVYSLRKWMRLAAGGNPSVLVLLFAPEDKIEEINPYGLELRRDMTQHIISLRAGERFAGYLHAQRKGLLSHDGKGRDVTRPELIEAFGFDTKFAGHMVRLGYQGVELLRTGRLTLPMRAYERELVKDIRLGEWTMQECLDLAEDLEAQIRSLIAVSSDLPAQPDYDKLNAWMCESYRRVWSVRGNTVKGYEGAY
jgi:hypothetical protein